MVLRSKKRKAGALPKAAEPGAAGDGTSGTNGANGRPASKTAKTAKKAAPATQGTSAFQVPDALEVFEISQTQSIYKSNRFRLQLEELLRELTPRQPPPRLEAFLRGLKPVLQGLSTRTIPEDFAAEFPHLCFHQRHPFPLSFAPPKRIDVVGSYLLGTCLPSDRSVDLALEMPPEMFQSKDYLNFRYMDKRAAYVGEVHRQLASLCAAPGGPSAPLAGMDIGFQVLQGDPFRPCVLLRPAGGGAGADEGHWVVRLLPTYSCELWPPAKLAPDKNGVRPLSGAGAAGGAPPTAHYNSCILEDARMRAHLDFLHQALQRAPELRGAILLLKKWASAHGLLPHASGTSSFTCLNGFCLSVVAAHASHVAGAATPSFQLFKLALNVLASTGWDAQKLTLNAPAPAALSAEERRVCGAHFYDSDGAFNFFWRLAPFIGEVRWEAQRALRILDTTADPYDAVFGHDTPPELLWDLVVRTLPLGMGTLCPDLRDGAADEADSALGGAEPGDLPEALATASRLAAVLSAGLGDRCTRVAVRLLGDPRESWRTKKPSQGVALLVGVILDTMNLERAIDRGPSAQDVEAAARFRKLWGPKKSELRRFKDGSILECVAWTKPAAERGCFESKKSPAVVTQIVHHVLGLHFPRVVSEGVSIVAGPIGFVPNLSKGGQRLWAAFEAFKTHICQLSSLPLTVKDVHPVDAGFSYTEVGPQNAPVVADGIVRALHEAVVEFESSGRWPHDPSAARKVGGALLLQMREELQTDLGIEAGVTEGFLDVRYPEYVFRLRIFHPHEHLRVANHVTSFKAQASGSEPPDEEGLGRLRELWWKPRLRNTMHAQVLQQPPLAGAVRLCKRWMASQMLSGYDEFVEHLVAAAFLQPAPFEVPTSAHVGLCRFCWLLDVYDWRREPLVVDFEKKLTEEERLSLRQSFEKGHAEAADGVAFWVCSRFDPHAMLMRCPPATVGAWLQRRARQALAVFHRQLLSFPGLPDDDWYQLFAVDMSVFDLRIRLLPQSEAKIPAKYRAPQGRQAYDMATGAAFSGLVAKLRKHLAPVCLVFHDADSRTVGLKWRPNAFLPQPHNVLMSSVPHTMIAEEGQPLLCIPNVLCLTSMIESLAAGLRVDVSVLGA